MSMAPTVCQTEKLDGVWPSAGRREELETPELLAGYLAKIGRGKLLTHQEEISLARWSRSGDQRARDKLVERNLRLVVSVAKKYRGYGLAVGAVVVRSIGNENPADVLDGGHFVGQHLGFVVLSNR